jgi:hypothetical protein
VRGGIVTDRMDNLMDAAAVAKFLGVKPKTVYQNWRAWDLPAVRVGGGTAGPLRFRPSDVEALLSSWRAA